jgi:glutamate N-acetyltransferase/amino-acid N-acetyltransferase
MGRSGIKFDPETVDLYLGNGKTLVPLLEQGRPIEHDNNYLKRLLKPSDIKVHIKMNNGEAEATGWGADITTDYVLFNSVYTT